MSIFEYDEEKHIRQEKEESWKEGFDQGIELTKKIFRLHLDGKTDSEIAELCGISVESVSETLN